MSNAALGYHKVMKENRTLHNMVQDLKGISTRITSTNITMWKALGIGGKKVSSKIVKKIKINDLISFYLSLHTVL